MTGFAYTEWVSRGLRHQWDGRPVDAMICYRQALRMEPRAVDARLHLGEILWQFGRLDDAIGSWREAVKVAPDAPAPAQALAEALLGTGDARGARAVAGRLQATRRGDARLDAIVALCDLVVGDAAAAPALLDALRREPALLVVPTVAGTLALTLERDDARSWRDPVVDAIAAALADPARLPSAPALLVAQVAERLAQHAAGSGAALAALVSAASARAFAPTEGDALRRLAVVAQRAGRPEARRLAAQYAQHCAMVERPRVPLLWPRRTAGDRLRVGLLVAVAADGLARAAEDRLTEAARGRYALVRLVLGATAPDGVPRAGDAAAGGAPGPRDADPTGAPRAEDAGPIVALGRLPTPADAQRITQADLDVLIDLAGLAHPTGAFLAQRPARHLLTLATLPAPMSEPLIDEAGSDVEALLRGLERAAALPVPTVAEDAATLDRLWRDALAAHQSGDRDRARAAYERVLAVQPEYAPAEFLRGSLDREDGELAPARERFARALRHAPGYVDAEVAAIRAAIDAGDAAGAKVLADAAAGAPLPPPALLRARGLACLGADDAATAAGLFEVALAREPLDGETHYNHGVALQTLRRLPEAARAYQRALTFAPALAAADFNLGVVFADLGNRDGAIAAFGKVLERDPRHVQAYKQLGDALLAAGRIDDWERNFRRFEQKCPDALPLAVQALEVCQCLGEFARLEHYLEGLRQERFQPASQRELVDALEELLYLLLFFDVEADTQFRFMQTYDTAAQGVYGPPAVHDGPRRPGRIRVGYLSADLRNHVMGKMMWQALQHHDRLRFELSFYSTSDVRDEWTERFVRKGDRFETLTALSDRDAAARIAGHELDLLVDLSTHTRGARPGILAGKPARVQVTHVASAGVLGLQAIDFKLTDHYADVPENQATQFEALLPMAGCVFPYRHVEPATAPQFTRRALGIAEDAVVIGAFVTAMKLSRRCLGLWREVLARVPRARLAFSPLAPAQAEFYRRLMRAMGIAADRYLFLPQGANDAENQARYRLVDFVLDPMPFGGVNGTIEALDMGVPVVTLLGRRHAERMTFSILSNLGVTTTVAQSGPDYVNIAARLADEPAFAAEVRAAIRRGLAASPLVDLKAHASALEAAYGEALAQRAPAAWTAIVDGAAEAARLAAAAGIRSDS